MTRSQEVLFLLTLACGAGLLLAGLLAIGYGFWLFDRRVTGVKKALPGFEVKQNTVAEAPVLREKEHDHG